MNKLNITIDLDSYDCWDCGNGATNFIDDIMNRIAENVLQNYCGNKDYGDLDGILSEKVDRIVGQMESRIESKVLDMVKKEYLKNISDSVAMKLEGLCEKTKAYRDIKAGLDIEPDRTISSGLRQMVKDVVSEEVRKMIRV